MAGRFTILYNLAITIIKMCAEIEFFFLSLENLCLLSFDLLRYPQLIEIFPERSQVLNYITDANEMNDAVNLGFGNDIYSAVRFYFYPDHVVRVFLSLTGKRGRHHKSTPLILEKR